MTDITQKAQDIMDTACLPDMFYANRVVQAIQADIVKALRGVRAAEREACAVEAETETSDHLPSPQIAAAIRSRADG